MTFPKLRMTKFYISILIFFFLQSCRKANSYSLEETEIAKILCDLHVAEAAVAMQESSKKDSLLHHYYRQVYEIHHLTESDFRANMEQLQSDLEKMERVYKIVKDSIEIRRSKI